MATTANEPRESRAKQETHTGEADHLHDVVISRIGPWGRWQLRVFLLLSVMGIVTAWQVLSANFTAPDVDHWCARPKNSIYSNWTVEQWKEFAIPHRNRSADGDAGESKGFRQCEMYDISNGSASHDRIVSCAAFEYDQSEFPQTITSEWDLVCGRSAMRRALGGVYMVGYLVGVLGFGVISDKATNLFGAPSYIIVFANFGMFYRMGRRNAMLATCVQCAFFSIAMAFCTDLYLFLAFRFMTAAALAGATAVSFVLLMELVGGIHRSTVGVGISMSFSMGLLLLPAVAYFIRPWRHLQFVTSIPSVFTVIYIWLLPESPRWLLSQGRTEDAEKYLEAAEKFNNRSKVASSKETGLKEAVSDFEMVQVPPSQEIAERKTEKKATILDLFKTPNMRNKTLNLFYNWFVNAFVYYGLTLNIGDLGGDVYVNTAISGLAEMIASLVAMVAIIRIGRRLPLCFSLLVGGVACLLAVAVPSGHFAFNWPIVALASMGKFGISGSFVIIYVVTAEIFPTVVRNSGVGASSMFARVGSIIAPFVPMLDEAAGGFRVSMLLYGATSILAGILTLLLPETNGKKLPETMEDGENFK